MRGAYRRETLEKLALHLYGVVTGSGGAAHTFGQVRWAGVLTRLLHTHKRLLRLTLAWRPLVDVVVSTQLREDLGYQGTALRMAHLEAVLGLVRASRRFFPPGSAAAIWAHCQPGLRDTGGGSDDALHAAGWLALLLPCTHIALEGDHGTAWGDMATEMVDRLAQVPNAGMWTCLWMTLLSRCAKHDIRARIPWPALRPAICTAALACFELPIGGTSVAAPFSRRTPGEVMMLFMMEAKPAAGCAAKIMLYTLGGTDPGLQRSLDLLVGSLCHYAHPSNGGAWTHALAKFLRAATSHLVKRRATEVSSSPVLERPRLDGAATSAVVTSLMSLASRAQFSKSGDLASAASSCLASLAYIAPAAALPLVVARFGSALDEVTATHQLPHALTSLALCVRPLLAAPPAALAELAAQLGGSGADAAGAMVAQALYGCLPGLDANDPPKTMAAVRFFAATLSTLPGWLAEEGDGEVQPRAPLPVDWPAWSDELLSRIFGLLSALEEGATAGLHAADNGTFLGGSDSFKPLCDMLFARLSPTLRLRAARRVAALASEAALPGVAHELTVLLSAACGGLTAQQAADVVVTPLVASLASELEHVAGAVHLPPSREALLCARAHRVPLSRGDAAVLCRGALEGVLGDLWRVATATKSNALLDAASSLLMGLLGALLTPWPGHCHAPEPAAGPEAMDTGSGDAAWRPHCVAAWTPGSSSGAGESQSAQPVTWNVPGPEALAFADALVATYGLGPSSLLVAAASGAAPTGAAPPSKEQVRCWVMQIDAVLTGCQSCLPPAGESCALGAPYGILSPWAGLGITIGGGAQTRDALCTGLAAACTVAGPDDADSLAATLHAAEEALCPGNTEYEESNQDAAGLRVDAVYCSQPRNGPKDLCPGDAHLDQGKAPRRRRPLWLVVSQAQANMKWRASQAAFFQCGGPPHLTPAPPPASGASALLATVQGLCSSRYKAVREAACGVLEQVLKRHPQLGKAMCEPFLEALGTGSSDADGTGEEVPLGAVSVLCTRSSTRLAASDEGVRAALLSAMLASSKHQGPRAQSSIQDLFLVMAIRFVRLHAGQVEAGQPLGALRLRLLTAPVTASDGGPAPTHWRFQLMATACVAFMLVPGFESGEQLRQLVPYFGAATVSDVAPLRPLGAAALLSTLRGARAQAARDPAAAEACNQAVAALLASPGFVSRLCTQLALSHAVPDAAGGGAGSGGGHTALSGGLGGYSSLSGGSSAGRPSYSSMSGDSFLSSGDALWRSIAANVVVRDWAPYKWSASTPKGIFAPLHAALFSDLTAAAPTHLLPHLQQPLTAVLGQAGDRAGRALAAEAMAGAFHACHSSHSEVHSTFTAWAAPAFVRAALEAPAEARGDWIMAAAYAVGGGSHGRAAVLAALAAPPPATAAAGAHARRLLLLRHSLAAAMHAVKAAELDVADSAAMAAHDADVACVVSTAAAVLTECTSLHDAPLRAVRDGAASLSAMLLALAAVQPCADQGADAPLSADIALLYPASGVACVRAQAAFHTALAPPAAQFLTALPERAAAAADGVLAAEPPPATATADASPPLPAGAGASGGGDSGRSVGNGASAGGAVMAASADMARMESFLKLVSSLIRNGDVAVAEVAQRLVVPLLPAILRVQRTRDPEFDALAKRALGHVKLARLPVAALGGAVEAIMAAACDEAALTPWHARQAALMTLPYVTFKHTYLWPPATVAAVTECVIARLADPRLEVRQAAAATLAGLIQGPASEDAPALRARFLAAARAGAAAALGPNPASIKEPVASVHARVLALSACILASPYDTPAWLPPLVVALAAYSTCPLPPVRSSVLLTFAEFKRTHGDTWAETKAAFGEEAWDKASQGLELSPSYFC
jgi:hypothetical protein